MPLRRQLCRLRAAALLWTTALGAAGGAAVPATGRFSLAGEAAPFFVDARLHDQRSVPQSFAFDPLTGELYALQVEETNAAGTHAQHDARGDLVLTRLGPDGGAIRGHMVLRGFGHGVSLGIERDGAAVYVWTEIDAEPTPRASARGTRLGRFRFEDGAMLTAASSAIQKFAPVTGARGCTPGIDPVNGRLAMRYVAASGEWRAALFDLAALKAGDAAPLADIRLPAGFGTVQGWCTFGSFLYVYAGEAYGPTNPPPGNATLWCLDWNTAAVVETQRTEALVRLAYREPEGLAVRTGAGAPRLCFGFGTNAPRGESGRRLSTAFVEAWRAPETASSRTLSSP